MGMKKVTAHPNSFRQQSGILDNELLLDPALHPWNVSLQDHQLEEEVCPYLMKTWSMPVPASAVKRDGYLFLSMTWRKGFLGGHSAGVEEVLRLNTKSLWP